MPNKPNTRTKRTSAPLFLCPDTFDDKDAGFSLKRQLQAPARALFLC
jgi:hypothetical protein